LGISTDYVSPGEVPVPTPTSSQQVILNNLQAYYTMDWTLNGNVVENLADCAIHSNTTFVARWTPIVYTINYNGLGYEKVDYYSIETGDLNYFRPTKDHYVFVNWYSSPSFNTTPEIYRPAGSVGPVELYARWSPRQYRITYHTNVENKYNPRNYTIVSEDISLVSVQKEGYDFKGWFLDAACTQSISTIVKGSYGDLNLYPLWEAKSYKVTYVLPDGFVTTTVCKYGDTAELPEIKKSIFEIIVTDKSRRNITENTEINIKIYNIWYVYVLGILALAGAVVGIVFAIKKSRSKKTKLRYVYQASLRNKRW
jgi:uncharacterized repeat protein (TIGR02543 family)